MKGDFSRLTFRPGQHYLRLLQQQGRPQLDADWNEQVAILAHRMQMLSADMAGHPELRCGAPVGFAGFEIRPVGAADDFGIARGRYYIDGLCCECDEDTSYVGQQFPPPPLLLEGKAERDAVRLVYLDAWEAVVVPVDDPALLEPALDGLDTALRTRVLWQVRMQPLKHPFDPAASDWDKLRAEAHGAVEHLRQRPRGMLRVQLAGTANEAGRHGGAVRGGHYRRPENLLYRVEVHEGGTAGKASFKWSRENGAQLLALASLKDAFATVVPAARDAAGRLTHGTWLELCDRNDRLLLRSRDLVQVDTVEQASGCITLIGSPAMGADFDRRTMALRPWDQLSGDRSDKQAGRTGVAIVEGTGEAHWIDIEDGIQVQFEASATEPHHYRTGDYWLIPARTADEGTLLRGGGPQPPDGVEHYLAPLALFVPHTGEVVADYRPTFQPLAGLQDQVNGMTDDLSSQIAEMSKQITKLNDQIAELSKQITEPKK